MAANLCPLLDIMVGPLLVYGRCLVALDHIELTIQGPYSNRVILKGDLYVSL